MTEPADSLPSPLQAITARCEHATKGPWDAERVEHVDGDINYDINAPFCADAEQYKLACAVESRHDAEFIAHAREDIPALVALCEQQENTIGSLQTQLTRWQAARGWGGPALRCPECEESVQLVCLACHEAEVETLTAEIARLSAPLTPTAKVTLTEEHACKTCEHQIYDHAADGCRVRRSSGQMCECREFVFRDEGKPQ